MKYHVEWDEAALDELAALWNSADSVRQPAVYSREARFKQARGALAMAEYAELISQAMQMPLEKRAELAHRLIISLEPEHPELPGTLEDILAARQRRMRDGNYVAFEAQETLYRIQKSLGDRRKP